MCVYRNVCPKRADDVDLPRRVVDVIVAADHVRDAHVEIVDHHTEVVRGYAVAAHDDQIVQLGVGDLDPTFDLIIPGHASLEWVLEPVHWRDPLRWLLSRLEILGTPASVVAWLLATRHLLRPKRLELRRR